MKIPDPMIPEMTIIVASKSVRRRAKVVAAMRPGECTTQKAVLRYDSRRPPRSHRLEVSPMQGWLSRSLTWTLLALAAPALAQNAQTAAPSPEPAAPAPAKSPAVAGNPYAPDRPEPGSVEKI